MKRKPTSCLQLAVDPEIMLRQLQPADAGDIFNLIDSQRDYLGRWLPFVPHTKSQADSLAYIESLYALPEYMQDLVFGIHFRNHFSGLAGFKNTDRANQRTEIGYWLSEHLQHKGIMTKTVRCLIDFAFDQLDIHRISIRCATGNYPSQGIPKRLGFTTEGIERDGERLAGGNFSDIQVFSLLRTDKP